MGQPIFKIQESKSPYKMLGPDGKETNLDIKAYQALLHFIGGRHTGSVEIHFASGGVAGVIKREVLK